MEQKFWLDKWTSNQIGFHELNTHNLLKDWWPNLKLKKDQNVLVPLCGKSLDMIWLMERHNFVIGIELSEIAAKSFFQENNLTFERTDFANYSRLSGDGIIIYCGDIFEIPTSKLGVFDCIYDRAGLVALLPSQRKPYRSLLCEITAPAAKMLLVTVNYDKQKISPPPHILLDETLDTIYSDQWTLNKLATQSADIKGITGTETCYLLEKS